MKERKRRAKLIYAGDDHRDVRPDFDGRKQYLPPDNSTKGKKKGGKKGILADQDPLVDEKFDPTGTPNGLLTPLGGDHGFNSRLGSAQSSNSALQSSSKAKNSQKSQKSLQSSRPTSKQVDRPPFPSSYTPFPSSYTPFSSYYTPFLSFIYTLSHPPFFILSCNPFPLRMFLCHLVLVNPLPLHHQY